MRVVGRQAIRCARRVRRHIVVHAIDVQTRMQTRVAATDRCVRASLFRRTRATVVSMHARSVDAMRGGIARVPIGGRCGSASDTLGRRWTRVPQPRAATRQRIARVIVRRPESHCSCGFRDSARVCGWWWRAGAMRYPSGRPTMRARRARAPRETVCDAVDRDRNSRASELRSTRESRHQRRCRWCRHRSARVK